MAVNSAEYRTLKRHTPDLRLAVKPDLLGLGGDLFAADLITKEHSDELRNQTCSEESRSASLIGFIQDKVAQDPQNYHTFVSALEKRDSLQYGGILNMLQESYRGMLTISSLDT